MVVYLSVFSEQFSVLPSGFRRTVVRDPLFVLAQVCRCATWKNPTDPTLGTCMIRSIPEAVLRPAGGQLPKSRKQPMDGVVESRLVGAE